MFKRGAVILATLVVAAGLFVGVSRTGSAEAATSCYGGAVNENFNINNGFPKDYGPFYTTSRCNDINMRLTTDIAGVYLDACVVFVKYTNQCNHGGAYVTQGPPWGTVATDVKDGTKFVVRVRPYDADAQNVNFQLAF